MTFQSKYSLEDGAQIEWTKILLLPGFIVIAIRRSIHEKKKKTPHLLIQAQPIHILLSFFSAAKDKSVPAITLAFAISLKSN